MWNVNKAVLVHSQQGTDQIGVLIACYLVSAWQCPASYAIRHLKTIRPGSIENIEQENAISHYYEHVFKRFDDFYIRKQVGGASSQITSFLGTDMNTMNLDFHSYPERYQERNFHKEAMWTIIAIIDWNATFTSFLDQAVEQLKIAASDRTNGTEINTTN